MAQRRVPFSPQGALKPGAQFPGNSRLPKQFNSITDVSETARLQLEKQDAPGRRLHRLQEAHPRIAAWSHTKPAKSSLIIRRERDRTDSLTRTPDSERTPAASP